MFCFPTHPHTLTPPLPPRMRSTEAGCLISAMSARQAPDECSTSPHILTLPFPPQDAIDRGWLLDFRSCVRGKPRMSVLLPHTYSHFPSPPQDAIDRGWLLDFRSCVRGKPRMSAVLDVALGIARGIEYMHSKVWGGCVGVGKGCEDGGCGGGRARRLGALHSCSQNMCLGKPGCQRWGGGARLPHLSTENSHTIVIVPL